MQRWDTRLVRIRDVDDAHAEHDRSVGFC